MSKPEDMRRYIQVAKAIIAGSSLKEAGVIIGVSAARARQILQLTIRRSRWDASADRQVAIPDDHDPNHLEQLRQHADFWLERIVILEQRFTKENSDIE